MMVLQITQVLAQLVSSVSNMPQVLSHQLFTNMVIMVLVLLVIIVKLVIQQPLHVRLEPSQVKSFLHYYFNLGQI